MRGRDGGTIRTVEVESVNQKCDLDFDYHLLGTLFSCEARHKVMDRIVQLIRQPWITGLYSIVGTLKLAERELQAQLCVFAFEAELLQLSA